VLIFPFGMISSHSVVQPLAIPLDDLLWRLYCA
jgi:hypothetical protein